MINAIGGAGEVAAESALPVHLIGRKKSRSLLIHIIRSCRPCRVPPCSIPSICREVAHLCWLLGAIPYQIMIWVCTRNSGWKYYTVLPGGLIPAWDLPAP